AGNALPVAAEIVQPRAEPQRRAQLELPVRADLARAPRTGAGHREVGLERVGLAGLLRRLQQRLPGAELHVPGVLGTASAAASAQEERCAQGGAAGRRHESSVHEVRASLVALLVAPSLQRLPATAHPPVVRILAGPYEQ